MLIAFARFGGKAGERNLRQKMKFINISINIKDKLGVIVPKKTKMLEKFYIFLLGVF